MAGGKYVKGQPSSNPTGRPNKWQSVLRQVKQPLKALGCTDPEIWAIALAYADKSKIGIAAATTVVARRLSACATVAANAASNLADDVEAAKEIRRASGVATFSGLDLGFTDGDIF